MNEASERSLSILRTLSQEHIERNRSNFSSTTETPGNPSNELASSPDSRRGVENSTNHQSHNSNSNYNHVRKINQSFLSALFHKDNNNNHSDDKEDAPSRLTPPTTIHNDYTNMGNKQSSNRIDLESRLAYDDYFENNPTPKNSKRKLQFLQRNNKHSISESQSSMSSTSASSIDNMMYDDRAQQYFSLEELVDQNIYIVRQKAGYCAILFSILQTLILAVMMLECSVAPLNINREFIHFWLS